MIEFTATPVTIKAMLAAAVASVGDVTIKLEPGAWPAQAWSKFVKGAPNKIMIAADFTLPEITMRECEGFEFNNLKLRSAGKIALMVYTSKRITVSVCELFGDPAQAAAGVKTKGVFFRDCQDVEMNLSRFHDLAHGVTHQNCDRLTISLNVFREMYSDAIRGGGTCGLNIVDNDIADQHQVGEDHLDAIQTWTSDATRVTKDVLIAGNICRQGSGDAHQGMHIRDQDNTGYENVVIRGNAIMTGGHSALMIDNVPGVLVEDNFAQGFIDEKSSGAGWSGLRLE
jgi:hypothetical protein